LEFAKEGTDVVINDIINGTLVEEEIEKDGERANKSHYQYRSTKPQKRSHAEKPVPTSFSINQ